MNIQRILKIQLIFFTFLSVIVIPAASFGDFLPDNFFTINSSVATYNFFTYYFSTFFAFASYMLGYCFVFSALLFIVLYIFIYSRRAYRIDLLAIFLILSTGFTFFYLFFPQFIGHGFYYILEKNFTTLEITLIFISSLFLLSWLSFRHQFLEALQRAFVSFVGLFKKHKTVDEIESDDKKERFIFSRQQFLTQIKIKYLSLKNKITSPLIGVESKELIASTTVVENEAILKPQIDIDNSIEIKTESPKEIIAPILDIVPKIIAKKTDDSDYFEIVNAFSRPKKTPSSVTPRSDYYEQISLAIQSKLAEFNIEGKIVNVLKGPIVDTFELELGAGVRVGKVEGFEDDLSLALQGVNVRIVPQMRGKSTMGIEVPRNMREREIIYLDQILNSPEFQKTSAQLPLAMGKDVFGKPAITDLTTLPHLLVAGTTGSGKSVYLNSILVSLLVKKSPSQMKLILIDPKRVELAMFSKLPHLLMPTITDHRKAAVAFLWAIEEMERRYQILLEAQVKNISAFNDKLEENLNDSKFLTEIKKFYPDDKKDFHLPYIVIVIDEFANLVSSNSGKEIEQSISTLAAKARASGIHLILATQRPSVDVVSGIVKTNFPTRIAFRVASPQDSKTILNLGGAEKLLGRGDMLFLKDADMLRMHSAYIVDEEIEATTKELMKLEIEYDQSALEMLERETQESSRSASTGGGGADEDEFYPKALELVLQARTASATMLQRRLGIGYPRAGKLIDMLEANGVIGPPDGAKPRKVLISSMNGIDS